MALAIYRKYRPHTFEEVIGQDHIVHILREAARKDRIAHAYLFAGPRGTGKTTTARLIAKIMNCIKRANDREFAARGEPCNECRACQEIDGGRALDVVEIDAASNRGIDEIRNLRESVRVSPISLRTKIFIIDEAHQLTKDAWNALLKTLEEPPPGVHFVLATTEAERIPPTILSRVQQFYFRHIPVATIVEKLKRIATTERSSLDPEAAELIASASGGSFRDAESLLDQLIAFHGNTITAEQVEMLIGKVGLERVRLFARALLMRDLASALDALAMVHEGGFDLTQFAKDAIHYLRRTILIAHHPTSRAMLERTIAPDHLEKLVSDAAYCDRHTIATLQSLLKAYSQIRYSQFPLVILEVAVIESLRNTP
jgi:DNA polymerase-3 subunit gamma/tau